MTSRQHPETGGVGIEVEYDNTTKVFTPEQIVACMLTKVRGVRCKILSWVGGA